MSVRKNTASTDLKKLDAITDTDMDYSDNPELDESFFSQKTATLPKNKDSVTLMIDHDVWEYFKNQKIGCQTSIDIVLTEYVNSEKRRSRILGPDLEIDYENVDESSSTLEGVEAKEDAEHKKLVRLADKRLAEAFYERGHVYYSSAISAFGLGDGLWPAIEDYAKAIEIIPKCAEFYVSRAEAYVALQDYVRAIEDYSSAIDLNQGCNIAIYFSRGFIKEAMGLHNKAICDYTRAINLCRLYPATPKVYALSYFNRGFARYLLGEHRLAIEDFSVAVEHVAELPTVLFCRGLAKYALGKHEEAKEDYAKALSSDENIFPFFSYILKNHFKCRLVNAVEDFEFALQVKPNRDLINKEIIALFD